MEIHSVKCSVCGAVFKGDDCEERCREHEKIPVEERPFNIGDRIIKVSELKSDMLVDSYTSRIHITKVESVYIRSNHEWGYNGDRILSGRYIIINKNSLSNVYDASHFVAHDLLALIEKMIDEDEKHGNNKT